MIKNIVLNAIQNELVKDFLAKKIDSIYRMRGLSYFKTNSVMDMDVVKNGQVVEGVVRGTRSYITRINFLDDSTRIKTNCSCPIKEDCKHVAALMYQLLEGNKTVDNNNNNPQKNQSSSSKKDANNLQSSSNISTKPTVINKDKIYIIENQSAPGRANLWRPFVLNNQADLSALIKNSKSSLRKYLYFSNPTIKFTYDGVIKINASGYHHEDTLGIEFRKVDDLWNVRCKVCSDVVRYLCSHQVGLVEDHRIFDKMVEFIKKDLPFVEFIAGHFGISKEQAELIKDNFAIINDGYNFYVEATNSDLLVSDDKLFRNTEYNSDLFKEEELENRLKKELADDTFKNGLCFYPKGEIIILEGKVNKPGTKLTSRIKETQFPNHAGDEEIFLYQKLKKLSSNPNEKNKVKQFLYNNKALLSSLFTYYDTTYYSPYDSLGKNDLVEFKFTNMMLKLMVTIVNGSVFTELHLDLVDSETDVQASTKVQGVVDMAKITWMCPYFIMYNGLCYFLEKADIFYFLSELNNKKVIKYFNFQDEIHENLLGKLTGFATLKIEGIQNVVAKDAKRFLYIRLVGDFLLFEPKLSYENMTISLFRESAVVDTDQNTYITYDEQEVIDFKEIMLSLHPEWLEENTILGMFQMSKKEVESSSWFFKLFQKCTDFGIELYGQDVISSLNFNKNKGKVSTTVTSGIDWFEAKVEMSFGDLKVEQKQWVEAIKNNEKFVKLNDGTLGLIPEQWINKLKKMISIAEINSDGLQISKMKFNIIDELFEGIDNLALIEEINQKKAALINYEKNKKYVLPTNKNVVLRPYQKQGYQWLKFLDEFGFGGCLADDMGLGKTVQVITFLLDQKKSKAGTSLVVVPKSLLFNWEAELKKFAPTMTYHLYHGSQRSLTLKTISDYDLVISTYDTVANDISMFKEYMFNYIILDESQAIKNIASQRYKAMRLLASRNKIVMTGTPIENNTFDLYAQISFINPGLLGSASSFKNNFANPIDGLGDMVALDTLKKVIHPFLLRRTKDLVAKELPEKSENIILCEMGTEQRKMYDALKLKIKQDIETKVEQDGTAKSKFMILDGLLRLRQICNSPALVDKTLPAKKRQSVKIDTLIELLEEDLGTHKALVYSQFVGMLTLIREQLDAKGIKYAYLDGSTNDRGKAVSEFMDVDDCHVFLLSIKAGNAGLNLTKADYVYIVDPWWNPAVEAQAIDRTHRIGQSNNVFAYRMICKDTIEEKIVELQKKKRKLATDLVQTDENVFKSLEKDELLSLFD